MVLVTVDVKTYVDIVQSITGQEIPAGIVKQLQINSFESPSKQQQKSTRGQQSPGESLEKQFANITINSPKRVCKHYLRNECLKGTNCSFLHPDK